MFIKFIVIFLLLFIVFSLFKALFCMLRDDQNGMPMSHYLGRRVFFSVIVLLLVIIAIATGLITPNTNPYLTK